MKGLIVKAIVAVTLIVGLVLPLATVVASPDPASLTVNYNTSTGPVSGLTVNVTGPSYDQTKHYVSGSTTFTGLADGNTYTVTSTKGASARVDNVGPILGDTILDVPCADLVANYKTSTGDVSSITSEIRVTGGGSVQTKSYITGSYTFRLLQTDGSFTYDVKSTKGASTRTDTGISLMADPTTFDIPCADLVVNYKTSTGDLSSITSEVRVTGGGSVQTKSYITGSYTFRLLQTDGSFTYDVKSTKGASTRTDTGISLMADPTTFDIPCADLIVAYHANNNPAWGMSSVTAEVRVTGGGSVQTKSWISGSYTFRLLQTDGSFTYDVKSTKGASTRTDTGISLMADPTTFDVPVGRFQIRVVKSDFTLASTPLQLQAFADGGLADQTNAWKNVWDVSLLAGIQYEFRATKGGVTASTTAVVSEVPPPGLVGVILMLP